MNQAVRQAAQQLTVLLSEENASLRAHRYETLPASTEAKRQALEALRLAEEAAESATGEKVMPRDSEDQVVADALRAELAENKSLLERAMATQNRIMGVLADAARQAQRPQGYGARGTRGTNAAQPVAISARA